MISMQIIARDSVNRRKLLWMLEGYDEMHRGQIVYGVFDGKDSCCGLDMLHRKDSGCGLDTFHRKDSGHDQEDFHGQEADVIIYELGFVNEVEGQQGKDGAETESEHLNRKYLKGIRERYPDAELILMAGEDISLEDYLLPEIRPILFLRIPFGGDYEFYLTHQLQSVFRHIMQKKERESFCRRFSFRERSFHRMIPYGKILYFETRDKKILVYTDQACYSFYDSFAHMERELSSDFIRCHRSYLVNSIHIEGVDLVRSYLLLEGGHQVPISRRYRRKMEEVLGRRME